MRRILALAVGIAVSAASSAAAAPTLIAPLHGGTTIDSFGDLTVWSDYNATDKSWHLVVDSGGLISTPPIPTATNTIEANVGPGPSGSRLLVYKVCRSGCHLVVSGVDGSDPRAVPDSDDAWHPTIWGDRVAWVRGANQVMTSLLDGSARRMLGGAPRRLCQPANKATRTSCEATTERTVTGLQLYYGRLALTDWSEGKLYFYADGLPECVEHCIYVYGFDPARDTYVRASASTELTGFSMAAGLRAYEATAPGSGETAPEACAEALKGEPAGESIPCVVRLSSPIAFRRTRPPIS